MNNNSNKIVRLGGSSDKYIKPVKTYQSNLSKDQIKEKLLGYRKVDIREEDIPTDSHIRYFSIQGNDKLFRLGGFVKKIDNEKRYIVLTNNKNSWCVNCKNSILFKKIDYNDYKKLEKENSILRKYLKEYKAKNSQHRKKD